MESVRDPSNKSIARIVRNELNAQLPCDELRRRRTVDQNIDDLQPILHAAFVDLLSEHIFCALFRPAIIEIELAAFDVVRNAGLPLKPDKLAIFFAGYHVRGRSAIALRIGNSQPVNAFATSMMSFCV